MGFKTIRKQRTQEVRIYENTPTDPLRTMNIEWTEIKREGMNCPSCKAEMVLTVGGSITNQRYPPMYAFCYKCDKAFQAKFTGDMNPAQVKVEKEETREEFINSETKEAKQDGISPSNDNS